MASKLDPETRELWEKRVVELPRGNSGRHTIPDANEIFTFIDQRARTVEHSSQHVKFGQTSAPKKPSAAVSTAMGEHPNPFRVDVNYAANSKKPTPTKRPNHFEGQPPERRDTEKCLHCGQDHKLWGCENFRTAPILHKQRTVGKGRLCYNCLSPGHQTRDCVSRFNCRTCKGRHHSLLHEASLVPAS